MQRVTLIRRIPDARALAWQPSLGNGLITPSRCPAVRQASGLGVHIASPIQLSFFGPRSFEVHRYSRAGPKKSLLVPGVIGDPSSQRLYARVDTGYSFRDLPLEVIQVPASSLSERLEGFTSPIVTYPVGYTGPILAAISANSPGTIEQGAALMQLIVLGQPDACFEETDHPIDHQSFDGLFDESWPNSWIRTHVFHATDVWTID